MSSDAPIQSNQNTAPEVTVPVGDTWLYARQIGQGRPVLVLHGGPDFDHTYLLPDMDRLSDVFQLIYYDQRGRGKSARNVRPEDVTMHSEVEDLELVRRYFQLDSAALLGHSWGGLLSMEYAIRHPGRVSHLILMNTAPASRDDYLLLREDRRRKAAADLEELQNRSNEASYQEGDPDAVADYYQIHFRSALGQPQHLEQVVRTLRASFTKEGILKARAIEKRLLNETWLSDGYDLLPQLRSLNIPTLILHGDQDLIPLECAFHIALAIHGARFVLLEDCGHFAYLERPDEVHRQIVDFIHSGPGNRQVY